MDISVLERLEVLRGDVNNPLLIGNSTDGKLVDFTSTTDKGSLALRSSTSIIDLEVGTDGLEESRLSVKKDTSNISFVFKDNHSFIETSENTSSTNHNYLFSVETDSDLAGGLNPVKNIFSQNTDANYQSDTVFKPVIDVGNQETGIPNEIGLLGDLNHLSTLPGLKNNVKELLTEINNEYVRTTDNIPGVGFKLTTGKPVVIKSFYLYDQIEGILSSNPKVFPRKYRLFAKVADKWIEIYNIQDGHLYNKRNDQYEHIIKRSGVSSNEFVFLISEVHIVSSITDREYRVNIGFISINVETSTRFINNIDLNGKSIMNTHQIIANELVLNGETYTKMFRDVSDIEFTEITDFVDEHQFDQLFNPRRTNTTERSGLGNSKQYIPIVEYVPDMVVNNKDLINVRYDNSVVIDHLLDVSNIKAGTAGIAYVDDNHQLKTSFSFENIAITDSIDISNSIKLNNSLIEWDNNKDVLSINKRIAQTDIIDDLYVFPLFHSGYQEYEEIVGTTTKTNDDDPKKLETYEFIEYQVKTNDGNTVKIIQSIRRIYLTKLNQYVGNDVKNAELIKDILYENIRNFLNKKDYYRTWNNILVYSRDTAVQNKFGTLGDQTDIETINKRSITINGNNYFYVDFIEYHLPQEILLKYISYEVRDRQDVDTITDETDNDKYISYYPPKKFMLLGKNVDDIQWDIILDITVDEYDMKKLNEPIRFYTNPTKTYSIYRYLIQDIHTLHYTNTQLRKHHFENKEIGEGDRTDILVGCEFSDFRIHGIPKSSISVIPNPLKSVHKEIKENTKTFQLHDTSLHINNQNIFVSPEETCLTINSDFNESNVETASIVHINKKTKALNEPENLLKFGLKRWDGHKGYVNNIIHSGYINDEDRSVYSIDVSRRSKDYSVDYSVDYIKNDINNRTFNITKYDQGGIVSINTLPTVNAKKGLIVKDTLTFVDDGFTDEQRHFVSIKYNKDDIYPINYTLNLPNKFPAVKDKLIVKSTNSENEIDTEWVFDPIQINEGTNAGNKYHLYLPYGEYPDKSDIIVVDTIDESNSNIQLKWIKNHLDISTSINYKVKLPANPPSNDQKVIQVSNVLNTNGIIEMEWVNQDVSIFQDKDIFMGDSSMVVPIYSNMTTTETNDPKITHIQHLFVGDPQGDRQNLYNKVVNGYDIVAATKIYAVSDITTDSDLKYKDDLRKIENASDIINKLNGYTFTRNDAKEYGDRRFTGLIAQEVEAVLPEAILKKHDGALRVMYGNLAGIFVEAIKECRKDIEELKREVIKLRLSQ